MLANANVAPICEERAPEPVGAERMGLPDPGEVAGGGLATGTPGAAGA